MGRVTIKDIAKETGLSIATVSYVLNGKDNVLEETKKIVQDAADQLGYIKNYSARSLVMNTSNLIGVVIPQTEPGHAMVFENPFYSEILSSIEYHARLIGYHVIVTGTDADEKYYNLAKERNLDGIIIIGAYPDEFYDGLKTTRTPIVLVDSYIEGEHFHSVTINDIEGAYSATQYLIDNGHKDIAFISGGFKNGGVCEKRCQGYRNALKDSRIEVKKENIITEYTDFDSGMHMAKKMIQETNVTAVFCSADILALGVIKQLTEMGIKIPEDISIMGFDNLGIARYSTPGLTTVGQDVFEKGKMAVELIQKGIHTKNIETQEIVLKTKIVIRESVAKR